NGPGSGAGGLAAHIDQGGAGLDHGRGVPQRLVALGVASAVGERVGGDVEDAHHMRTGKIKNPAAALQPGCTGCVFHHQCSPAGPPIGVSGRSPSDAELPEAPVPPCQSRGSRGGRPAMMSSIWSESMVSYFISASAIMSSLSRFSVRMRLAVA